MLHLGLQSARCRGGLLDQSLQPLPLTVDSPLQKNKNKNMPKQLKSQIRCRPARSQAGSPQSDIKEHCGRAKCLELVGSPDCHMVTPSHTTYQTSTTGQRWGHLRRIYSVQNYTSYVNTMTSAALVATVLRNSPPWSRLC